MAFLSMSPLFVCAQSTVLFQEDFESGPGDFIIDNDYGIGSGLWHVSTSCKVPLAGHTQGGALYYGQDDFCDYDIGIANRGVVDSPPIDLTSYDSGPIELRFKYYLEVELVNCRSLWDPDYGVDTDLATVEISADGGYFTKIARNCWASGLIEFFSTPDGWTELMIDLSDYAGSVIQLRFGFNTVSNSQNYYDGFYVDDVIVYGPPCSYAIAGDINHDCVVDMADWVVMADMEQLAAMVENWLLNCRLTPSDPGCVPE
ncbi:MAG: hypothetical protein ABFR90_02305 [Planctomycetota bacterium]